MAAALSALAALATACGESDGARRYVRQRMQAHSAGSVDLTLAPAQRVRFETEGGRFGAGLRLHLWDAVSKREVAFAAAPRLGADAALEYVNPRSSPRGYVLLYETSRRGRGNVTLLRDGRPWLRNVPLAVRVAVPSGKGYASQLASVPGHKQDFRLFGLDCGGRLRAVDRDSGPTGLPRIAGFDDLCSVVVHAAKPARVSLYVNDPDDRDGDGLGRSLERALGTCDGAHEPGCGTRLLASYYRGRGATRDSDRDGLSDAAEVLGAGRLLDLPRYGASPLHKDVFVEIDHDPRLPDIGLRETELAEIAALYARGSARELKNPDGQPGVSLHFDAGFEPSAPQHVGLFGAWGGSGSTSANNYRSARNDDFTPQRAGYFRYAFMTKTGRGQARRDSFTVNRDLQRVSIFAHELGHTLGLAHHGIDDWGRSNCKPNYYSIMNYVYQNRVGVGFSRSAGLVLDPASVLETLPLDAGLPPLSVLREPPLELDVFDAGIDWNRDGVISREPVRAGLSWATYKSCGSAGHARTTLTESPLMAATPALARTGERLYALYVTSDGLVRVRHAAVSGPDGAGSCPEGDAFDTRCSEWSMESLVYGIEQVQHIAVLQWAPEQLLLGYAQANGQLRLAVLAAQGEVLELRSDVEIPGARSDHAPALARARVAGWRYGSDELLRVMFRAQAAQGQLLQATARGPAGPFRITAVFDGHEQPIVVGLAPSLIGLNTDELCGVLPDAEGYVRFHCYDVETDAWIDLTRTAFFAGSGPKTAGPVGLAYHRYRLADGALVQGDATRGALILSFTEPESPYARVPDNPHYFISESLSARQPARTHTRFRWRGRVIDEWTNLAPGTGLALYEDASLSALKGLMLARVTNPDAVRLDFLPFADGAHQEQLGSGNDFDVMERGICEGLRGQAGCGGGS